MPEKINIYRGSLQDVPGLVFHSILSLRQPLILINDTKIVNAVINKTFSGYCIKEVMNTRKVYII